MSGDTFIFQLTDNSVIVMDDSTLMEFLAGFTEDEFIQAIPNEEVSDVLYAADFTKRFIESLPRTHKIEIHEEDENE